ncbi:hypothetical protein QCA50_004703 [Cerrena zonata]|uniref:Uncharacterized protein n=1 Tax=Cerrena zonata TaxID=2478898 RepID=A0AAW0GJI8_9APHY
MPFNVSGTLVSLHLLINPRILIPSIIIKDIRQLQFHELRKAGYKGAIFDKDNCLTIPHHDQLVPELNDAWKECRETFGDANVLIVSNSAGTKLDAGDIQAESVSHHLSTPVLRHKNLKPSFACISTIRNYFSSLPTPIKDDELIVVGDRIFTDIVLANRMSRKIPSQTKTSEKDSENSAPTEAIPHSPSVHAPRRTGPLSIWTTGVWERESMAFRFLEKKLLDGVKKWVVDSNSVAVRGDVNHFVKELPLPPPPPPKKDNIFRRINRFFSTIQRD